MTEQFKSIRKIIDDVYPVSNNSLTKLYQTLEFIKIAKGQNFIKINKNNNKEYFLISGICRSFLINPEGEEITISFFQDYSVLSPYITRTSDKISNINFQALTEVQMAGVNALIFRELMDIHPDVRAFAGKVLKNELLQKVEKEIGLASLIAMERLIQFRKKHPSLENLIPHPHIASYLGITNISLSRLRGNIAKKA